MQFFRLVPLEADWNSAAMQIVASSSDVYYWYDGISKRYVLNSGCIKTCHDMLLCSLRAHVSKLNAMLRFADSIKASKRM